MRILTIGNFLNPSWDGSMPDEEHIAKSFERLGHEVTRWQREDVKTQAERFTSIGDTTIDCDFVLIAQWDQYPDMSWLKIPKVYWAFDYQADGQEWHERLVAVADLYLSKRVADSKYPNWQWFSQDFAPDFLARHHKDVEKDIDVLFTGSYLPWATERNNTLRAVDMLFNLEIHSANPDQWKAEGFKNVHGPSMDTELPELYARARVNLSIDHMIEAGYWSDRNAQIMACGGLVLFRYVPLSETVFHDHIAYFHSMKECVEQLNILLDKPDKDLAGASISGYRYAQQNLKATSKVIDFLHVVGNIL